MIESAAQHSRLRRLSTDIHILEIEEEKQSDSDCFLRFDDNESNQDGRYATMLVEKESLVINDTESKIHELEDGCKSVYIPRRQNNCNHLKKRRTTIDILKDSLREGNHQLQIGITYD